MSSKSTAKRKASTPAASSPEQKKVKIPKSFISRPSIDSIKSCTKIFINPEIFEASELSKGNFIHVSKTDASDLGILGLAYPNEDILDKNIIQISSSLRELGGILLGDRLQFTKFSKQPEYAKSVSVSLSDAEAELPIQGKLLQGIEKALDEVGLIFPGMEIYKVNLPTSDKDDSETTNVTLRIMDINHDTPIEESLSKLSLYDDEGSASPISTVSPAYLFFKGKSTVFEHTLNEPLSSKYPNLPQRLNFGQVGGLSKEISLLQSTIQLPLHNPTLFSDFGISPPRGILLHGPPGTGETENAIRDIFQEAKRFQPAIVFMDEIDSLAPNRNSDDSGETESRVVATLLTMMDGMGDTGKIVVVGATNRPNSIDPALRRPGRFDQEVEIGIPDVEARKDILAKQFAKMNSNKYTLTEQDIMAVASKTHGYVGADLTALCRESVMKAINRGLKSGVDQRELKLDLQDVEDALPDIRPSAMREIFLEMPKVYWSDIGGQEELKQKLTEVVQLPLEAAASFSSLGITAPKGVLLYGPPGCSKTLTAKALATESGLNFLAVKGPEIFNKYVGESERTIREIFRKARAASPSIIFFDEIDAISGDRESGAATTSSAQHVLTSLLNEIDGVEELKGVVIVAATNRPTEIDPALLRPGRLDRHIYVAPPDYEARLQILTQKSKKFNMGESSEDFLKSLAFSTEGCSGAEVALLCQEAGLSAIMEDKQSTKVEERHFLHALNGISKNITPQMLDYYEEFSKRGGLNV
ncbi:hypothetical protein QCA50_012283 [Cerrena zonata]|uniref:AAA+ ATPase domain-containing protein n=1 Tax=Cerrena zonata TaxID=2478898 RepID=A0AAW0G6T9_9APHY